MKTKLNYLFFLLFSFAFSQELPPIVKYSPSIYGAGNQNWMISQDKNHFVFFANNEGLLEFNASSWVLYPSPNETIIRSVKVIDGRVYTGCYMEFGFWTRQKDGKLKYNSLSKSLNRIYIYDTKTGGFQIIEAKNNISKSYRTKNSIYFQSINEGLFEIESGKGKLVSDNPILKTNRIVNVFDFEDGLLIQTQLNGFFKLVGSNVSKFSTEADAQISSSNVYSSQMLSDGSFALGTVSNGIYILTKEGKIKYHITQSKGLSNNTALSLFEDFDKNLWMFFSKIISFC